MVCAERQQKGQWRRAQGCAVTSIPSLPCCGTYIQPLVIVRGRHLTHWCTHPPYLRLGLQTRQHNPAPAAQATHAALQPASRNQLPELRSPALLTPGTPAVTPGVPHKMRFSLCLGLAFNALMQGVARLVRVWQGLSGYIRIRQSEASGGWWCFSASWGVGTVCQGTSVPA